MARHEAPGQTARLHEPWQERFSSISRSPSNISRVGGFSACPKAIGRLSGMVVAILRRALIRTGERLAGGT
jgi:hypothetical protein